MKESEASSIRAKAGIIDRKVPKEEETMPEQVFAEQLAS